MRWTLATKALAAVLIVGAGCRRESKKPPPPEPDDAVESSLFADAFGFDCSPVKDLGCNGVFPVRRPPSEAAILHGGEDAFRARVESLRNAKRSIRIQALIFRGDESGLFIADLLKKKKSEGVDVKVIVDAVSNLDWQTQWMYFDLKQHGIEVEGYEALYLEFVTAEIKPTDPLRPNKRFHDKMWVVDAEDPKSGVAIIGGLNIANEYFRVDSEPINRWTDQDVIVRGPIMDDVREAFDRNYAFFKDIKETRPLLLNPDNVWKLARSTVGKIKKIKIPLWRKKEIEEGIAKVLETSPDLDFSPFIGRFLQSRPRFKESYITQAYANLVEGAKESIYIANAYFIPSRSLSKSLKDAAQRGVKVVIVTNSPETNDIRPIALISRHVYKELLEANQDQKTKSNPLEIREWAGAPFKEGTLHAKFAVFDGKRAIVGSYNLDPRSERLNSETALAIDDATLGRRLEKLFLDHYVKKSNSIGWEEAIEFRKPKEVGEKFELLFALPLEKWL